MQNGVGRHTDIHGRQGETANSRHVLKRRVEKQQGFTVKPGRRDALIGVVAALLVSAGTAPGCAPEGTLTTEEAQTLGELLGLAPVRDTDTEPEPDDAIPANTPPVANAGADQTVVSGDLVVLDATGSLDLDRDRLSFFWTQAGGDPVVEQGAPFASINTFEAPVDLTAQTTLTFRLTVIDGFYARTDDVSVTILPR